MREGTRQVKEEDFDITTRNRKFVPIELIETIVEKTGYSSTHAFFTVGVLVESSGVRTSKNNKQHCILKVTDLLKYDTLRVKKQLASFYKDDPDSAALTEKSFNSVGYKTMKVLAFDGLAKKMGKLSIGTVVCILNPRPMKRDLEHGISFVIDMQQQVV